MYISTRIALLLAAISSMAYCSALLDITHEHEAGKEGKYIYQDLEALLHEKGITHHELDRIGKKIKEQRGNLEQLLGPLESLLGLFSFDSSNCTVGQCLSQEICTEMNGTEVENSGCALGFGVCCTTDDILPYAGGNTTITGDGGDFFNPGAFFYPAGRSAIEWRQDSLTEDGKRPPIIADLYPEEDHVQMMIKIIDLNVLGPVEGDCSNDSLVITGANPGLQIPVLCGKVTNEILYIDIDNSKEAKQIILSVSNEPYPRTFSISIEYLSEAKAVPRRCLQYKTTPDGTIQSFNYGGSPPMALFDQEYTICFKYLVGYCDVAFNFETLDLGCDSDYLRIGDDKVFDDSFDNPIMANATDPIYVNVRIGDSNEQQGEGFKATYTMMGC